MILISRDIINNFPIGSFDFRESYINPRIFRRLIIIYEIGKLI